MLRDTSVIQDHVVTLCGYRLQPGYPRSTACFALSGYLMYKLMPDSLHAQYRLA